MNDNYVGPDCAHIRKNLKLSQQQFADRFGFSVSAVRNWEQGIREPERSAQLLLVVISLHPKIAQEAAELLHMLEIS